MASALRFVAVDSFVFARIAAIPKQIGDALWIIHDFRRCGTNKDVKAPELIVLPRARAIAADCMELMAYWRTEQIYLVLVFGLKSAPLVWSRVMALISRLTQGLLHTSEARLSVYIN